MEFNTITRRLIKAIACLSKICQPKSGLKVVFSKWMQSVIDKLETDMSNTPDP